MTPKNRHGAFRRRLADLGIVPPRKIYKPPPKEHCHIDQRDLFPTGDMNDPNRLVVRYSIYKGRVVDFSINQSITQDGAKDIPVARIDCCGGTIHRHQYNQDGVDVLNHQVIIEIPPGSGWETVDKYYPLCIGIMEDEWQGNLGRWRGDRA